MNHLSPEQWLGLFGAACMGLVLFYVLHLARKWERESLRKIAEGGMCSRCMTDTDKLVPARCAEKPELLKGSPLGMYHCPDCYAVVFAGIPHGTVCVACRDLIPPPATET